MRASSFGAAIAAVVAFSAIAQESIPLAPFPEFAAPRAVTVGPHDHFLANYFGINAWSPDKR